MLLVLLLVALVVPWQVAFLGCWAIHLVTCATSVPSIPGDAPTPPLTRPLPRSRSISPCCRRNNRSPPIRYYSPPPSPQPQPQPQSQSHDAEHALLLLTWLLPLAAPVLAVWARTLVTAGLRAAVAAGDGGDHSAWSVAPYLVLVDFASWTRDALLPRDR